MTNAIWRSEILGEIDKALDDWYDGTRARDATWPVGLLQRARDEIVRLEDWHIKFGTYIRDSPDHIQGTDRMSHKQHCPSCGQYEDEGHAKDCMIGAQQQNTAHRERNAILAAKGKITGAAGQVDWQERAASMLLKASVNDTEQNFPDADRHFACETCHDSGEIEVMTHHLGPDDYTQTIPCPDCAKGTTVSDDPKEAYEQGHRDGFLYGYQEGFLQGVKERS